MSNKKNKRESYESLFKVRKPIPRPGTSFKDKSKYSRKRKHKGNGYGD